MISVIVPTYNEKNGIAEFLRVLNKSMQKKQYELILMDDSNDGTNRIAAKVANELNIKSNVVHRREKSGKGSAVSDGLKLVKGETIVIIDADLEYHPRFILPMIRKLDECDLVTAVRIRKDKWYRRILGALFKSFVHLLFSIPFETQSGLKVMKSEAVKGIELKSKGWVWDVELIKKVMNNGFKVCTHIVPYTTREKDNS